MPTSTILRFTRLLPVIASLVVLLGCQTTPVGQSNHPSDQGMGPLILREGDTLKVAFPGNSDLDTTQQIRRDGMVTLALVGEMMAAGSTPLQLEKKIVQLYADQLVSKSVTVTVVSSTLPVFVTGAVVRPGKIMADRPLTALEAVMEAGGFDYAKANIREVMVIRHDAKGVNNYKLDLSKPLEGKPSQPFYLKPSDIVFVPERFSWF